MTTVLIVPVNLAALCVGAEDVNATHFARLAPDFSHLPYLAKTPTGNVAVNAGPNVSDAVLPAFFQSAAPALGRGIHLHWVLPAALAHGVTDEQGSVHFRPTPNRWLVVRIASNRANAAAPRHSERAWIVESDRLWDLGAEQDPLPTNRLSLAVPLNPAPDPGTVPNKPFLNAGRVFPLERWSETEAPRLRPFTALGYGEVTFAAYAHSPNVFGLHDPVEDLDAAEYPPETTRLSYMVAGWYSDTKDDPLTNLPVALIEHTLGWTFDRTAGTPPPERTVCNGLLHDITWDPKRTRYIPSRDDTPVNVAVGNTTAEAVSALLAHQPHLATIENVEQVLNALQLGLLARLPQTDGLFEIEEALHQATFVPAGAGVLWTIRPKTAGAASGDHRLSAAAERAASPPRAVASDLAHLNLLQQEHDALSREIDARRRQIFADWHKFLVLEYSGGAPPSLLLSADAALQYLRVTALPALEQQVNTDLPGLAAQVAQQQSRVEAALGADHELASVPGPRFWRPADPVLVLAGEDLQPAYRPRRGVSYDERGHLMCRTSSALITTMTIASGPYTVRTADLPPLPAPPFGPFASVLAALMGEAFFLDPEQAWILARIAAGKAPGSLWETIRVAQQSLYSGRRPGDVSFDGKPPAPLGVQTWITPWLPVLMQWEADVYPALELDEEHGPARFDSDFITSRFTLEDGIEMVDPSRLPERLPAAETYRGSAVLTHATEINIKGQIERHLQDFPQDPYAAELRAMLADLDFSMMAQAMGGFHQALLMRKQALQLPIGDPLALLAGAFRFRFSNVTVKNAVADQNRTAPLPENAYNPLRTGRMRLVRVRIVDVFGQQRTIDLAPGDVVRAASLRPLADDPDRPFVALPPRITQPARLLFRWLAADGEAVETNGHPASSPIFGWVMFNRLDASLMIYDADGTAFGSLNARGPLWQGAPGNLAAFGRPIEKVFAGANPHLRNFALGVHAHPQGAGFIADLLDTIDRTVSLVQPHAEAGSSMLPSLIGRPLALVRASLRLELEGPPALNQSWRAFAAAATAGAAESERDAAAFPEVDIPVRLGDLARIDDGLIGYFIEDGSAAAYQTLYAAAAVATARGVVRPTPNQLTVRGKAGAAPRLLSMLVDPRAAVHATAGLLPVKSIRIPPDLYGPALPSLAATFLASPVLSPAARLAMPLPEQNGYRWSWVELDPKAGQWREGGIGAVDLDATAFSRLRIAEGWLKLAKESSPPAVGEVRDETSLEETTPTVSVTLDKPTLYITDDTSLNARVVTVTNHTGVEITLRGGTPVPEEGIVSGGPTSFYLTFGGLLTNPELEGMQITSPGWQAAFFAASFTNWAICPEHDVKLAANASIALTISNLALGGQPRSGALFIDYYNVPKVSDNALQIKVMVQRPPAGLTDLKLKAGFLTGNVVYTTRDAASQIRNRLYFSFSNPSPSEPLVREPWLTQPPVFNISFVHGTPPGYGALNTARQAAVMDLDPAEQYAGQWTVSKNTMGEAPYWEVRPQSPEILGVGAAATVEFVLDNVISDLPVGGAPDVTLMYVQYANIPGYNDGFFTLKLVKQAGPAIMEFSADPGSLPFAATAGTTTLRWKAENADSVSFAGAHIPASLYPLEGTGPLGEPLPVTKGEEITITASLARPKIADERLLRAESDGPITASRTLRIRGLNGFLDISTGMRNIGAIVPVPGGTAVALFQANGGRERFSSASQVTTFDAKTGGWTATFDLGSAIDARDGTDHETLAACVSPEGRTLYAAVRTQHGPKPRVNPIAIVTVDATSHKVRQALELAELKELTLLASGLMASRDGTFLVFSSSDLHSSDAAGVKVIATADFKVLRSWAWPKALLAVLGFTPYPLGLDPSGRRLYVWSLGGCGILDLDTGGTLSTFSVHEALNLFAWSSISSPDGSRVYMIASDKIQNPTQMRLIAVDVAARSGQMRFARQVVLPFKDNYSLPMALTADGRTLYVAARSNELVSVDTNTMAMTRLQVTPTDGDTFNPRLLAVVESVGAVLASGRGGYNSAYVSYLTESEPGRASPV
jgi:hypothetical protein